MDWPIHHIDSPPSQEELRSLRVFEVRKNLWTLVFQSLVALPNGENDAEDIVERYQNTDIVRSFDTLLTFLVQSEKILGYSPAELKLFYETHFQDSSFESCLIIFDKWPFAKSFCAAIYGDAVAYPQKDILTAMRVLDKLKPIHQKFLARQPLHYKNVEN